MTDHSMIVAGIDTGKLELHVHFLPHGKTERFRNDEAGIARLIEACRLAGVVRCGIEATSIYHRQAMHALRQAGFETAELQPRQAKAFAIAVLEWSKSDPIDARVIAKLTQALDTVKAGQDPTIEPLAESLTYLEQIEERIAWLKTTLERFLSQRIAKEIKAEIKRLKAKRRREMARLEARLRKSPHLSRRFDLLLTIPGIGQRTALAFLIRMPELGSLTREQAARLSGLAPCLDESGKRKGERHIYGGRTRLRIAAFMAAFAAAMQWNNELKAFYRRLVARGKAHTAAVTACARKLIIYANTVLARATPWQEQRVMP